MIALIYVDPVKKERIFSFSKGLNRLNFHALRQFPPDELWDPVQIFEELLALYGATFF